MTMYRLTARQFIPCPLDEVFAFFAEPRNLARITPAALGFEFLSDDFEMREGLVVEYRLRPVLGIPTRWRTEITDYEPPFSFTDIQAAGPYRRWEHHHTFATAPGGTIVEDHVEYQLPLGPLGPLGNSLLVRAELQKIFTYRARIIERVFAKPRPNANPLAVAVAGGTGFVGGAIARELHRRGENVVVLSHRGEEARAGLPDSIEIREADASVRSEGLIQALRGIDALVIALAFKNLPIEAPRRGQTFMKVDAAGTENLVDAARAAGVKHIVYMSGAGAEPNAKRTWFRAKWRAEQAVRFSGVGYTIIRPTWLYGPDDVSLNRFIGFARRLRFVPMPNFGRQRLAPVFIDDVAQLVADALHDPKALDQVFELGGPETLQMREIIARALRIAGLRRLIVPAPAPLIKLAVVPLVLLPSPPMTPDAIDFVNQPAEVDIRPLLERMPRHLTMLDDGLASYLAPGSGPGELHFETLTDNETRVDAVHRPHI